MIEIPPFRSVSVYADKNENLLLVPTGISKKYFNCEYELDIILPLNSPYSDEELENFLFEGMDKCHSEEPKDEEKYSAIARYLKVKGYGTAVKGRRLVSFVWTKEEGYSLMSYIKYKPRGFTVPKDGGTVYLGHKIEKGELAIAFKKALEKCEPY